MGRPRKDKEPFDDLSAEFKDAVMGMDVVEIKKRVAEVALSQSEIMKAKKEDGDLIEKREIYREANAIYREATKSNKSKIDFCKMVLDGKGA